MINICKRGIESLITMVICPLLLILLLDFASCILNLCYLENKCSELLYLLGIVVDPFIIKKMVMFVPGLWLIRHHSGCLSML